MPYTDEEIKKAVNKVFVEFDKDHSNCLQASEVANFLNAFLSHMKTEQRVGEKEVKQFIKQADSSKDGKIQKK